MGSLGICNQVAQLRENSNKLFVTCQILLHLFQGCFAATTSLGILVTSRDTRVSLWFLNFENNETWRIGIAEIPGS